MKKILLSLPVALLAVMLSGCATPPPATVSYPAPTPRPPPVVAATPPPVVAVTPAPPVPTPVVVQPAPIIVDTSANDRALQAAAESYDRGDFASAIRQLNPMVNDSSLDSAQLLRALKVLAFSQCSTNALTACRQTFERALKTDANFDLAAAERGHPIWGAQFARARRTVLGK